MSDWPEPKMVDTGTLKLAVYEYGDVGNPAVLLLHGFLSTGLTWHDVSVALAEKWHVLAVDQRGRSLSDHAPDGVYSTEAYVADAKALLDRMGIERVALVGHSMGGGNVLQFAATHPGMVTSVVVVDMAPEINSGALTQVAATIAALSRDFANWDEARAWQKSALPLISDDAVNRRLHARMVEKDGRIGWREDPAILSYRDAHPMQTAEGRWATLRQVRCRVQFVLGGESALVSDATADGAVAVVPEGEWVRIPRAGHNVFEDNPADSVAAIVRFLAEDSQQQ